MSVEAGGTFKCHEEAFINDTLHLWIILSDPATHPNQVVVVNVTSVGNTPHDPGCQLRGGVHPDIWKPSFVPYRWAKIVTVDKLQNERLIHRPSLTPQVLMSVREGAGKSRFIPRYIKNALIAQRIISAEAANNV